jgi:hypothetical protein
MWMVVVTLMVRVRSESLAQGGVMGMTLDVDLNRGLSLWCVSVCVLRVGGQVGRWSFVPKDPDVEPFEILLVCRIRYTNKVFAFGFIVIDNP